MTNTLGKYNTIFRGQYVGAIRPPFYDDLDTWHKGISGVDFAEKINNLPAKFLPRVGSSNGTSEKILWTTSLINSLSSWTVAFRMNKYNSGIGSLNFVIGGAPTANLMLKQANKLAFRSNIPTYHIWDGSGNTLDVPSSSVTTDSTIVWRSDGTNIYLVVNGLDKGYITPANTILFFNKFILGYSDDSLGANGNFWDLRIWTSDIGATEALKYDGNTMTVNPINWYPDLYSGYDVVSNNHADLTSNLSYDYELNGSTYPNTQGYSLWEKASNPDIQVPFDINGNALNLTAGVNIPTGYTKTRDIVAGGNKWNMADALIDFDPDDGTNALVDIFDRSNATIQNATSRASLFYDASNPYRYQINEIADPRIYDTFFEDAYKDRIFGKVQLDGTDLVRYDEELNYANQKV